MTISNNHEENELMEQQHDDNSGEQTDSGISSTFTNDMEQMFAETVNNVIELLIDRCTEMISFSALVSRQ